MSESGGTCPACGEAAVDGANFCEACGADLTANPSAVVCVDCSAPESEIDGHGYCNRCGHKQPAPRDHMEQDDGNLVAVTDKGLRHHHNEDAFALARVDDNDAVLIVCDGVSSTDNPQHASQAAADTTSASLVGALVGDVQDLRAALTDAVHTAQEAVLGVPLGRGNAPSCTIVATIVRTHDDGSATLTTAWLGDSRAYWVGPEKTVLLTTDHSWAAEMIAAGATEVDAMADPRAHTITRWLGRDAIDLDPSIAVHEVSGPGMVLVCSDGLWNYAASAEEMGALVGASAAESPIAVAQQLVQFAIDSGGHDNITVVTSTHGPIPNQRETQELESP